MLNSGPSQGARIFQRFLPSCCVYMQAFQWWALAFLSAQGRREDKNSTTTEKGGGDITQQRKFREKKKI